MQDPGGGGAAAGTAAAGCGALLRRARAQVEAGDALGSLESLLEALRALAPDEVEGAAARVRRALVLGAGGGSGGFPPQPGAASADVELAALLAKVSLEAEAQQLRQQRQGWQPGGGSPPAAPAAAAASAAALSSFVCARCGGVVASHRREAHERVWCEHAAGEPP